MSQSHHDTHSGHHHHHGHKHGHAHDHGAIRNIRTAFYLNLGFSIIEAVGGFYVGSLAIVADAVHDLGDAISLGGAWFLENYANRKKDQTFNFGYRRFSLLSALVSGLVISGGSIFVLIESIRRFNEERTPLAIGMIYLALLGLAANGFAAWRMARGSTQNERVLTWHLLEDVFGWAAVLLGALVIQFTGWTWVDPVLAIGLSIFVLFNVLKHLKGTLYLFLQGTPANFDSDRFLSEAAAVDGVERVDHLAVWSLDGEVSILSARLHLHGVRDPIAIESIKEIIRGYARAQGAEATLETCLAEHSDHAPTEVRPER